MALSGVIKIKMYKYLWEDETLGYLLRLKIDFSSETLIEEKLIQLFFLLLYLCFFLPTAAKSSPGIIPGQMQLRGAAGSCGGLLVATEYKCTILKAA